MPYHSATPSSGAAARTITQTPNVRMITKAAVPALEKRAGSAFAHDSEANGGLGRFGFVKRTGEATERKVAG